MTSTVKLVASALYYGPERLLAEKIAAHDLKIKFEPYLPGTPVDLRAMQALYASQPWVEQATYVSKGALKTVIAGGAVSQSCFSPSESRTEYYLVDNAFVVSKADTKDQKKGAKIHGVHHSDYDVNVRVSSIWDDLLADITPTETRKEMWNWKESIAWDLGMMCFASGLALAVVSFGGAQIAIAGTALKVAQAAFFVIYAGSGIRFFQFMRLDMKTSKISNLGMLTAQVRRWAYKYPTFAKQYPQIQKCLAPEELRYLSGN